MDIIEIQETVDSGEFNKIIGIVENDYFDAKSGIYPTNESGKFELVKDVCAFANLNGGIIIIGLKTKQDPKIPQEIVDSIRLLDQTIVDPSDYHNVIKEWIYPKLDDVVIKWVHSSEDSSKGLVYIYVPQQIEENKPYLINKIIDSSNRKMKEILFGYVERIRDFNEPLSIQNIHHQIRVGRESKWREEIEERIESLEKLQTISVVEGINRRENLSEIIESRINLSLEDSQLIEDRLYSLSIIPLQSIEVQTLLSSREDSIGRLLQHPPTYRYAGWAMDTGDTVKLINGEFKRVKRNKYKILDLYRDGNFIFACTATDKLLGWGQWYGIDKINPIAFIEITYTYFDFYKYVIEKFSSTVDKLKIDIQLRNLHINALHTKLAPYHVDAIDQRSEHSLHVAPENNYQQSFELDVSNYEPQKVAYQVAREVYAWFGIDEDKIPYVTSGRDSIDIEVIKSF